MLTFVKVGEIKRDAGYIVRRLKVDSKDIFAIYYMIIWSSINLVGEKIFSSTHDDIARVLSCLDNSKIATNLAIERELLSIIC